MKEDNLERQIKKVDASFAFKDMIRSLYKGEGIIQTRVMTIIDEVIRHKEKYPYLIYYLKKGE